MENEEKYEQEDDLKKKVSANTEELKNETFDTVKQVRENMKNVNVKEEAQATKGFITEMFKNPLGKIKEIANDMTNHYFKTAIILVIVWMAAALLGGISFKYFSFKTLGSTLLSYIKTILAPLVAVVVMSVIIFVMNKKAKKSLITVITTVVTAQLPVIIAHVISLLTIISSSASVITSKVTTFCSVITTVFMYFAICDLFEEKEEKEAVKKFAIVEGIYVVAAFIIHYLGIMI